jgi:hypothetical protein
MAPACPSGICLLPAAQRKVDTQSLCTADCTSDSDCADGETGPRGNAEDHHCETGFACIVPTTVGDFCCRRLCACKDFLDIPAAGYQLPPVCLPGQGDGTCPNVH